MKSAGLGSFIGMVAIAAVALLFTLPRPATWEQSGTLLILCGLASLASIRPVRIRGLHTQFTAAHPLVLCALAVLGGVAAVLVAVAGVVSAFVGLGQRLRPSRAIFNLGEVVVSTCLAYWTFTFLGGAPGVALGGLLWPLTGATIVFFIANSALVSSVVALDERGSPFPRWSAAFGWTLGSYFIGLPLAVFFLVVLEQLGPLGLALGIPPIWLVLGFYAAHRERLEEKQRRITEVERLNTELESRVAELREALAHVKQLQGLLPICMHCKSVRDDKDTWHLIESYLTEHTEARFTHGLCDACRARHYPDVLAGS